MPSKLNSFLQALASANVVTDLIVEGAINSGNFHCKRCKYYATRADNLMRHASSEEHKTICGWRASYSKEDTSFTILKVLTLHDLIQVSPSATSSTNARSSTQTSVKALPLSTVPLTLSQNVDVVDCLTDGAAGKQGKLVHTEPSEPAGMSKVSTLHDLTQVSPSATSSNARSSTLPSVKALPLSTIPPTLIQNVDVVDRPALVTPPSTPLSTPSCSTAAAGSTSASSHPRGIVDVQRSSSEINKASTSNVQMVGCNIISDADKAKIVKDFLTSKLSITLSKDFKLEDVEAYFVNNPEIKSAMENAMKRRDPHTFHSEAVKGMVYKHALMFSLASGLELSRIMKGPKKSSIKKACSANIKVLPYINEDNIIQHLLLYKDILVRHYNMPAEKIPMQVGPL